MFFGLAWIDFSRPPKPVCSVAILKSVESNYPKVVERALVLRIKIQNGAIKRLRCDGIILGETQIAQSEQSFRVVRGVGVGYGEFLFCERQIVRFQRLPAGGGSIKCPKGRISLPPSREH